MSHNLSTIEKPLPYSAGILSGNIGIQETQILRNIGMSG